MALSKIKPDLKRAGDITVRMQEIIKATRLGDPKLNGYSAIEFRNLRKELESMGLTVTWEIKLVVNEADPPGSTFYSAIVVLVPQDTTVH